MCVCALKDRALLLDFTLLDHQPEKPTADFWGVRRGRFTTKQCMQKDQGFEFGSLITWFTGPLTIFTFPLNPSQSSYVRQHMYRSGATQCSTKMRF